MGVRKMEERKMKLAFLHIPFFHLLPIFFSKERLHHPLLGLFCLDSPRLFGSSRES